MRSRSLPLLFLAGALAATAQQPIGVNGFIGNTIDYWNLSTASPWSGLSGDTWRFTSWASDSLLPSFPDRSGVPVIGTPNDGSFYSPGCSFSGGVGVVQISKLADPFTIPSSANTLLTPYTNCAFPTDNGWSTFLTAGNNNLGTWKGGDAIFIDNKLFLNIYRQDSPGSVWGDTTLFMSPDAGAHWIDYQHYFTYPATGASCSGNVVTLTAANALAGNEIVYVHNLGTGYDGMWTLTGATGSTVRYAVSGCPGAAASIGSESGFGLMKSFMDAPDGPNNTAAYNAGSMMWTGAPNPMTFFLFLHYGQDGNWDIPADTACDPRSYLCGYAIRRVTIGGNAAGEPTILFRVPRGHEFTKSAYQWYYCPGYNSLWPEPASVCDGNLASSWTSTLANATNVRYNADAGATYPGDCISTKYFSANKSYLMACSTYMQTGRGSGHYSFVNMPHPWGPFYPVFATYDVLAPIPASGWQGLMGYGEQVVSTDPPLTRTRVAGVTGFGGAPNAQGTANTSGSTVTCLTGCTFDPSWVGKAFQANNVNTTVASVSDASHLTTSAPVGASSGSTWKYAIHPSGSAPVVSTIEFGSGRPWYPSGIARRAFFQNLAQLGMGHRFSIGNYRGVIPLKGKSADGGSWSLDWWTDLYDHGGQALANVGARPFFRDLVSGGTGRYFQATDGTNGGFNSKVSLTSAGVLISNGWATSTSRLQGVWNDTTMAGNGTYTMLAVWNAAGASGGWADSYFEASAPLIFVGANNPNNAATMSISSYHLSQSANVGPLGDLCWRTGGLEVYSTPTNQLGYCTVSTSNQAPPSTQTVVINKWYFGAITVQASAGGNPKITINLCSGGACTEYGGGGCDLRAAANGASCNGMYKWCNGAGCSATPNVTSTKIELGYNPQNGGTVLTGTAGEFAVYQGAVPSYVLWNIYRTLRDDWARTGRGSL